MSARIRVSQVVGDVNVEDVQKGWEIRHKGRWRKVTHVAEASRRGHHPNYQAWHIYIEGRSTPVAYTRGTSVTVMARVEGTEAPFMPQVEPYPDGRNDGKLYITREQAGTLAEAMGTYFPDFENPDTTTTMSLIRRSLERFAKGTQ